MMIVRYSLDREEMEHRIASKFEALAFFRRLSLCAFHVCLPKSVAIATLHFEIITAASV